MIGKVIEGRYEGASINKLPDKNVLFIQSEDGTKVALSKKNAISIDDVTDQYPSYGRKVMMVMWNDFETSILQFEMPPVRTSHRNTNTDSISTKEKKDNPHTNSAHTPQMSNGRYCKIHLEKCVDGVFCNTCGRNLKESEILIIGRAEDDKHGKSKQSKTQMSTASANIPSTTTVGVETKVILLWLCIGLLLVGVFFKATVMNTPSEEEISINRIEIFNTLYDSLTQKDSNLDYTEQRKLIASYTADAGLDLRSQDPFSKTFVDEYIAKYSVDAFVEKIYTIYDEEYHSWDCTEIGNEPKCEYQMLNEMLMYALDSNSIELMTVTLPAEGAAGFYADYPDKVPETTSTEIRGKFYNSSGENVHYETKTCTTTGSAHGDFATMREEGYSYDEGRYEWKNGVFYDELPSWKPYDNTFYYYKGVRLGKIKLSTTQYFVLGDATYFLLSPESCSRGEHGRRKWLKVEVDEEALAEQVRRINIIKDAAKEEMHTFIPEVLKENSMNALYEAACKPEVWDSLSVTYQQEIMTGEQFSIDAVYSVKIGGEYVVLNAQLTGNLNKNSFDITAIGIDVSNDPDLYLDSATQELTYAAAEALLAEGKNIEAAMTFGRASGYSDATERSLELWNSIAKRNTICASQYYVTAILDDGTVRYQGTNNWNQSDASTWSDIVDLAADVSHVVGVKQDGTVVTAGVYAEVIAGRLDTSSWKDVVLVKTAGEHTVGLKADGSVIAIGSNEHGQCNVSAWQDIVHIMVDREYTIGLREDGTLLFAGNTDLYDFYEVKKWNDIIDICSLETYSIGLKSDGTIITTSSIGKNMKNKLSQWTDIVAISAGYEHVVGLKADGTVVAVGDNYYDQCEVNEWKNIVAICAGGYRTVGLRMDGMILDVGKIDYEGADATIWTDIKIP